MFAVAEYLDNVVIVYCASDSHPSAMLFKINDRVSRLRNDA